MDDPDSTRSDDAFLEATADALAALPCVEGVALGGSRGAGTHHPESDWDLAVYYRDGFAPASLRALGWPGEVSELGGWGGLFDGGAWLTVEGRRVDIHYRRLETVTAQVREAEAGRFHVEPLLFHLAGMPSYLLVAELASNRRLRGTVPEPISYPPALRRAAPERWLGTARLVVQYAAANNAQRDGRTEVAGALATAAAQAAHAVLAARGEWVTNEKRLLERAGLRRTDALLTAVGNAPAEGAAHLTGALDEALELFETAVREATAR